MNDVTPLLQRYLLDHLLIGRVHEIDALSLLSLLPDASVDAIICDPPYGLAGRVFDFPHKHYSAVNEEWDLFVPVDWMPACERVLKPGGSVVCFGVRQSIYQVAAAGLSRGWRLVNDITWEKPDAPPNFTGRMLTETTERALWFCPSGSGWTYNLHAAKEMNRGRNLRDIWTYGVTRGDRIHPTQKPLPLMERCIQLFTNPGDLVVDLFAGSGTTLVAAKIHGRRYLGSDITPEYVEAANKRLSLPYMMPMFAEGVA